MKKGNLFKNLVIFILVLTMLVPASTVNVKADDSTDANYDPNIYVDDDGTSYVISELPSYYDHEHLTEKYLKKHPEMIDYKNVKSNDESLKFDISKNRYYIYSEYIKYNLIRPATYDRDGVVKIYCSICGKNKKNPIISDTSSEPYYESFLCRIPRLKKVEFKKKYTWEEIFLAQWTKGTNSELTAPYQVPDYLVYKDTHFVDINGHKITAYVDNPELTSRTYDEDKGWVYDNEYAAYTGTVKYQVRPDIPCLDTTGRISKFYDVDYADCYYVVNPPEIFIGKNTFYITGMGTTCIPYTKSKQIYKKASNSRDLSIGDESDKLINAIIDGYEIQYSTDKNFKKNVKTSRHKYGALDYNKNIKYGSTYYIRYRAYKKVSKKYYYSSWTPIKKVKVPNKNCWLFNNSDESDYISYMYKFKSNAYPVKNYDIREYSWGVYKKNHVVSTR